MGGMLSGKSEIDQLNTLVGSLGELHEQLREMAPLNALTRIAVAVYDAQTDLLRTFIHSSGQKTPLSHYVAKLADVPSLREIAESGLPRVVNDISFYNPDSQHSKKVLEGGYRSSYTLPLLQSGELKGFLFFNAVELDFFNPLRLSLLWPYAQVAAFLAMSELDRIHVIQAAVSTVRQISRERDEETGAHLERMSRYTRLIAEDMAVSHCLSDEYIEFLFQFAPLHDIGKVGVPDNILLKPGTFTPEELERMRTHVSKGSDIITMMTEHFSSYRIPHMGMLFNVVSYHHENWDGTGYPHGMKGEEIPLEARITAVADVFDALTSERPYKHAWSNQQAFDFLEANIGIKFYEPCVRAMLDNKPRIEEIQRQFQEAEFD